MSSCVTKVHSIILSLLLAGMTFGKAWADGTEILGPPSITIALGTGVAMAGTGLFVQPGTINVNVPAGATVKQVLIYWYGRGSGDGVSGDDTIVVEGNSITGTVIGQTTSLGGPPSQVYRKDITGLGLVLPGANALMVGGLFFTFQNAGAGVLVIYDDGSGTSTMDIRDGHDFAAYGQVIVPLNQTLPQTYIFPAAPVGRTATVTIFVGDGEAIRPDAMIITVGAGPPEQTDNVINEVDGSEWDTLSFDVTIPAGETTVTVQPISRDDGSAVLPDSFCWVASALVVPPPVLPPSDEVCLVIIDEEGIDNDFMSIEEAAAGHGVEPDFLVNDDRPTEVGNPHFRWNELFPGDIVVLPTGQVDDEGWFALPPDPPFTIGDYAAGTVPQDQLDKIPDVMPLRNQDLARLKGLTCVAVVYDSDISMNYLPINANLQGARYGLFTFTVLDVILPGSIPESESDTSLYDLVIRVEAPMLPTVGFEVTVRDHEPDAIEITEARYENSSQTLIVNAESDFAPGAFMTVSVEGAIPEALGGVIFEEPMIYNPVLNRYEFLFNTAENLDGRRLTISTDEGGAYNVFIE